MKGIRNNLFVFINKMYVFVEWIDEEKVSIISLIWIKELRKDFSGYNVGEMVKVSCYGFLGIYSVWILMIKGLWY